MRLGNPTFMATEAAQSAAKICHQLKRNKDRIKALAIKLKSLSLHSVMLVGRGSSDHAGVYAKYLIEIELGLPTFAAAPSVASVYGKPLILEGCLVLIISQSGQSPDILEQARQSKQAGAYCVALLNQEDAPLASIVDEVIPLLVGKENSVAATKSFLATLSALLQLVAYWSGEPSLIKALNTLPENLTDAVKAKTQLTVKDLHNITNLVVLGRGLGYAVSKEIALKLKEVLAIHAEAFSSAEFLHGPVALVETHLKIVQLEVQDESLTSHLQQINGLKQRGAEVIDLHHRFSQSIHPRLAPLVILQRFYLDLEEIAVANGINPDKPVGLKKVTETL